MKFYKAIVFLFFLMQFDLFANSVTILPVVIQNPVELKQNSDATSAQVTEMIQFLIEENFQVEAESMQTNKPMKTISSYCPENFGRDLIYSEVDMKKKEIYSVFYSCKQKLKREISSKLYTGMVTGIVRHLKLLLPEYPLKTKADSLAVCSLIFIDYSGSMAQSLNFSKDFFNRLAGEGNTIYLIKKSGYSQISPADSGAFKNTPSGKLEMEEYYQRIQNILNTGTYRSRNCGKGILITNSELTGEPILIESTIQKLRNQFSEIKLITSGGGTMKTRKFYQKLKYNQLVDFHEISYQVRAGFVNGEEVEIIRTGEAIKITGGSTGVSGVMIPTNWMNQKYPTFQNSHLVSIAEEYLGKKAIQKGIVVSNLLNLIEDSSSSEMNSVGTEKLLIKTVDRPIWIQIPAGMKFAEGNLAIKTVFRKSSFSSSGYMNIPGTVKILHRKIPTLLLCSPSSLDQHFKQSVLDLSCYISGTVLESKK